jgi:hypothetical protein
MHGGNVIILLVLLALIVVSSFSYNAGRFHEIERWLQEKLAEFEEDEEGEEWKRNR